MTNTKTRSELIAEIVEVFKNDNELFNACIEELDSYNGYLGDDRAYPMEELEEFYSDADPIELLNRAYYGRDDENYYIDKHGEKHYESFNPNRDYFYYNGYGNLCSTDYPDYSDHIDTYAIEAMLENRDEIDSIDNDETLSELFDALECAED